MGVYPTCSHTLTHSYTKRQDSRSDALTVVCLQFVVTHAVLFIYWDTWLWDWHTYRGCVSNLSSHTRNHSIFQSPADTLAPPRDGTQDYPSVWRGQCRCHVLVLACNLDGWISHRSSSSTLFPRSVSGYVPRRWRATVTPCDVLCNTTCILVTSTSGLYIHSSYLYLHTHYTVFRRHWLFTGHTQWLLWITLAVWQYFNKIEQDCHPKQKNKNKWKMAKEAIGSLNHILLGDFHN